MREWLSVEGKKNRSKDRALRKEERRKEEELMVEFHKITLSDIIILCL